jgi:trehalose 6-phosphate synthase
MPNGVEFEGRLAHVGTFPIGIEPKSFIDVSCTIRHPFHTCLIDSSQNLQKPGVIDRISQLEQRFRGVKVIVGVDRLDYIKGVPQKLHALELFLTQHPEWIGKVSRFELGPSTPA